VLAALVRHARSDAQTASTAIVALLPLAKARCARGRGQVDELLGDLAIVIGEASCGCVTSHRVANRLVDRAWARVRRREQRGGGDGGKRRPRTATMLAVLHAEGVPADTVAALIPAVGMRSGPDAPAPIVRCVLSSHRVGPQPTPSRTRQLLLRTIAPTTGKAWEPFSTGA
jgi:hypothetical protein